MISFLLALVHGLKERSAVCPEKLVVDKSGKSDWS